jgi:TPR repeat protein
MNGRIRLITVCAAAVLVACQGRREVDEQLAERGDTAAMHRLCFDLTYGEHGLAQDWAGARTWCAKGADAGEASSQVLYAQLFEYGQGGMQSLDSAHYWYIRAGNQGHPHALYALAVLYLRDDIPSPVSGMAEALLDSAAAQGYAPAVQLRDSLRSTGRHRP